jgi:dihydrofolate reductase
VAPEVISGWQLGGDQGQQKARVIAIAAIGRNRGLGKGNELLYKIPEDFERMHRVTMGHPLIMGRKTWESIPENRRPLPGRANIIVTRQTDFAPEGTIVAHSVEDALARAHELDHEKIFIFGGAEIYSLALPYTDELDLTLVEDEKPADVFFPDYSEFTKVLSEEKREWNGLKYSFLLLSR